MKKYMAIGLLVAAGLGLAAPDAHTLAITQNNFVAEDNMGGALLLLNKADEAHAHFEAAARINPHDPMSHSNLGAYLQQHNQLREAVEEYESTIRMTSDPELLASTYAQLNPKLMLKAACWNCCGLVTKPGSFSSEKPIALSASWK